MNANKRRLFVTTYRKDAKEAKISWFFFAVKSQQAQ
jgi:hypothetical protein